MSGAVVALTDDELELLHQVLADFPRPADEASAARWMAVTALEDRLDEARRFAEQEGVTVVARDNREGDVSRKVVWNDAMYIAAGSAWVDGVVVHHRRDGTKTFVVTFKGVRS